MTTLAILGASAAHAADESAKSSVHDWETGVGKSYFIPAAEIAGFIFELNQFNRHFLDSDEYDTDASTFSKNVKTKPDFDTDPFNINQLGHPYAIGSVSNIPKQLEDWRSLPSVL